MIRNYVCTQPNKKIHDLEYVSSKKLLFDFFVRNEFLCNFRKIICSMHISEMAGVIIQ